MIEICALEILTLSVGVMMVCWGERTKNREQSLSQGQTSLLPLCSGFGAVSCYLKELFNRIALIRRREILFLLIKFTVI